MGGFYANSIIALTLVLGLSPIAKGDQASVLAQIFNSREMIQRTIHFVDWFAHELKGFPKDKDFMFPARELVQLGLIKHFPCKQI